MEDLNTNVLVDEQKVEQIFNDICAMKVCELKHLQNLLCSRLSLKVIGPMTQIVEKVADAKSSFEAQIIGVGNLSKVETIKAVKELKGLGLLEAKKAAEHSLPWSLGTFSSEEQAQGAASLWKDKGFEVTLV